jgi:hypothetical protein
VKRGDGAEVIDMSNVSIKAITDAEVLVIDAPDSTKN